MALTDPTEITTWLARAHDGDAQAWQQIITRLYQPLRAIARAQLRRDRHATINTTGLVHEWYLRLAEAGAFSQAPNDREHFYALAARIMRQVVCAYARKRQADKRGGNLSITSDPKLEDKLSDQAEQFVALDDALSALASQQPRLADVVQCRFFAGLSEQETADALAISLRTVQRDWLQARAWLLHELHDGVDA
jgi:RNA polymerase sigma factor (TIGR02999 family)